MHVDDHAAPSRREPIPEPRERLLVARERAHPAEEVQAIDGERAPGGLLDRGAIDGADVARDEGTFVHPFFATRARASASMPAPRSAPINVPARGAIASKLRPVPHGRSSTTLDGESRSASAAATRWVA